MIHSQKEFLSLFGWNDFFESHNANNMLAKYVPARIICEERNLYCVQVSLSKTLWSSVSGKMQFNAKSRADFPAVGDWVLVEVHEAAERAIIHFLYPRKTLVQRKQVGASADIQILSTNVDYVFITTSVNEDLNFRRIERYLAVIWASGAIPIILLTKTDTYLHNLSALIDEVRNEFVGVEVYGLSMQEFENADFLAHYFKIGKTCAFVGSSGVGKSTLVNYLIGSNEVKTQEVRSGDGKGRHTTTSRSMYLSRLGGLIIDTPGMRELQLNNHSDGVSVQFADIEDLIAKCRFNDCEHRTEPGCQIIEALRDETLSETRWKSYQKLRAEIQHSLRKTDLVLAAEERKAWKKISVNARKNGLAKRRLGR